MVKLNFAKIILLLLILGTVVPSAAIAQQSVRITWTDMNGERGRARIAVGDHIIVTWQDGKKAAANLSGKVAKIDMRLEYMLLDKGDGKNQYIPFDTIRNIQDKASEPGTGTSKPEKEDSQQAPSAEKTSATSVKAEAGDAEKAFDPNKTGIFVLPMSGTVGVEFRPEEIEEILRQADERGNGQVIVLEIDSGGGLVAEGMIIKEVIFEACKRHRVVAWVEKAVSGASWTALCCDEVVFKTNGYTGGITIMIGNTTAPEETVNNWIKELEKLLQAKNRSTYWAKPFVLEDSYLSATKDPETGEVKWFNDTSGDVQISGKGDNLYFNAESGVEWNFAIGVADTPEELAEVLQISEWELAGNGQELHDDLIKRRDQIIDRYQKQKRAFSRAENNPRGIRERIKILKKWKGYWRTIPNIAAMTLRLDKPQQLDLQIEALENALKEMTGN